MPRRRIRYGPGAAGCRRLLLVAAAAIATLAAVPIVYALTGGGSGGSTLAGIQANSVGIIDPSRNVLVGEIHVGSEPAEVAVGDKSVWVGDTGDRTVMQIDPAQRVVAHTYPTGVDAEALVAEAGDAWEGGLLNNRSSVARIDGSSATVTGAKPFLSAIASPPHGSFAAALIGRSLWAASGVSLVKLDPLTMRVQERKPDVAHHVIDMVAGGDSLWILNAPTSSVSVEASGSVTRFEPGTDSATAAIPVGGDPVAIAYGEGRVWVGLASGTIVRIDPGQDAVDGTALSNAGLADLAYGNGSIWAANDSTPTVARINAHTLKAVATIRIGTRPASIAAGFGKVWVTAY